MREQPHPLDLRCENKELLEEFRAYTSTDENSNRVGEFAVGTNTACTRVIGNILQDEKIPGIHIAFGHPYAEHTGQTGYQRRTSIASAAISTSGSMASR